MYSTVQSYVVRVHWWAQRRLQLRRKWHAAIYYNTSWDHHTDYDLGFTQWGTANAEIKFFFVENPQPTNESVISS